MKGYDSICCFRSRNDRKISRVCWEITTDCNLNCPFCHRYDFDPLYYDTSKLDATIHVLKKNSIRNIIISGGEPLLHPNFFLILECLYKENFELDICSNGTLITYAVAKQLKKYLSEITISIDGYEPLRHESMRSTQGCFSTTIENVSMLKEMGFDVHTSTVIDVSFASEILSMTDFLKKLGIRSIAYLGLIPINTGYNSLFSETVQKQLYEQIVTARNKYPELAINTKQLLLKSNSCQCGAGDIIWGLGVDGLNLVSCLLTRNRFKKNTSQLSQGMCPGSQYLNLKIC